MATPELTGPAFVPVKLLELGAAPAPPLEAVANPSREARRSVRRGAMEISLPNGAKVSLDADVHAEALRRVLARWVSGDAPVCARREIYLACKPVDSKRVAKAVQARGLKFHGISASISLLGQRLAMRSSVSLAQA